ncbi:MAG: GHMP kinase [Pelosinus sp.]|nr:GHMP kinase [Pelosinus sp.]
MKVKVKAPGSCGELVQGTIDGQSFLITCPIDVYSEVEVYSAGQGEISAGAKLRAAVKKTEEYLGIFDNQYGIKVKSDLPIGKGMASSSADISAACQAVALHAGKSLSTDEIAKIALAIEPTDGVFYSGIVLFDHLGGKICHSLGRPPLINILIFDVGGEVDTLTFNKQPNLHKLNYNKEKMVRQAVELVSGGLASGDARLIGRGATLSALANQTILYKPCLDKVIKVAEHYGAVGVANAHSGTVLGVLFSPQSEMVYSQCIAAICEACHGLRFVRGAMLVEGGLWKQEDNQSEWRSCS